MSAITTPSLLSIAEFDALPDEDDLDHELHEGELVEVTFPNFVHTYLQRRMCTLLEALIGNLGMVTIEMPFQIASTARQTKRRADIGFLRRERTQQALQAGIVEGASDLVIEVLSPSNSASKLNRYARLCLANGAGEFWIVDYDTKTIRVRHKDRTEREYELGESIALTFGSGALAVSEVFQDL
jgi:Uma2 family endonuclease